MYDYFSDNQKVHLIKIASQVKLPEFVKKAELEEVCDVPLRCYALPEKKLFPCHTKLSTWLSAAYLLSQSDLKNNEDFKTYSNIEKFANFFGISKDLQNLKSEIYAPAKKDENVKYAFCILNNAGKEEKFYPLDSVENVKIASDWLRRNRDKLPLPKRREIAGNIESSPYFQSVSQTDREFISKQAGYGIADMTKIAALRQQRRELVKSAENRQALELLESIIDGTPQGMLQGESLFKLAEMVDAFDYYAGLQRHYDNGLVRPEDAFFALTYEKAAESVKSFCELTTGSIYEKSQFEKLSQQSITDLFGDEFAREVCNGFKVDGEKMAELASTLPVPDADRLERLLQESAQYPVRKTKTAGLLEELGEETVNEFLNEYLGQSN
jgi:hypothetical protein